MTFRYDRFGAVSFALYDGRVSDTTGKWDAPSFRLSSGGAFDPLGSQRGRRGPYDLPISGDLIGSSVVDVNLQLQALKAQARLPGRLVRTSLATGRQQWAQARLEYVDPELQDTASPFILPVSLAFVVLSPCWYGVHHAPTALKWGTVANGGSGVLWGSGHAWNEAVGDTSTLSALSGTPQDVALINEGTLEVTAVTFVITAGSSPITSVRIVGNGTDLTWTGTLAAGKTLVIDGATDDVTNDGANAYAGLTWNSGHVNDDLFVLAPNGTTTFQITGAGGGTGTTVGRIYDAAYP